MTKIDQIISVLDDDNSLALGESPWDRKVDHESFEIRQVDWGKLFPGSRPMDRDRDTDWEVYGDRWDINEDVVAEIFDEPLDIDASAPEDWDVCAWYNPIHFHGYDWGIFIKEECLKRLACKLYFETKIIAASLNPMQREMLAKGLLRTAFSIFYHHELYHHKTECLGFRLHAVQRRSSYLPYFNNVYKAAAGTDSQIEEALANAFMYRDVDESSWVSSSLATVARSYLANSFPRNPPGYRLAPRYLTDKNFDDGQRQFFSQVTDGVPNPIHLPVYWNMAPRINQSIFNIKSDIWTIVPRGSKPIIPVTSTPLRTCSTDEIIKVCNKHGYRVTPGGKGSHIKLKKPGNPTLIVPGNRDNISPVVAKNILASLGLKINQLSELLFLY